MLENLLLSDSATNQKSNLDVLRKSPILITITGLLKAIKRYEKFFEIESIVFIIGDKEKSHF